MGRTPIERCAVVLLTMACAIRDAAEADLPQSHAPQESTAKTNCFASLWNWLNASISDCPLTYAGFTLYGTLDAGYGYDKAGIAFGKWYDKASSTRSRRPALAGGGPDLPMLSARRRLA